MAASSQPNILWIITDHQRTDSLSCYGSRWCCTPNFDRIATRGVRFANCTCQSPICIPSRTSLLTGRYPHAVGILENEAKPLPNETPLTWRFRDAGYQVVDFGKCDYPDKKNKNPFPWYEFGPGPGAGGARMWALAEGFDERKHHVVTIPVVLPRPDRLDRLIVGGRYPLAKEENEPGLMARRCDDYLTREAEPPFFLRISITAPHTPVLPAAPYFGRTDPHAIDVPLPVETISVPISAYDAEIVRPYQGYMSLTAEQIHQARANYYDLCLEIDAAVGTILESLSRNGYSEETIIAFNSDHGTLLGEYGIAQHRTFYDPVIQVPFLLAAPGRLPENAVVTDPVELVDFLPTLLALAGIGPSANVHGRNLLPQMRGEAEAPDRPTFAEIDYSRDPSKEIRVKGGHRVMVRQGTWKLFYFLEDYGFGEDGALYDLEADPRELRNLCEDPDYQPVVRTLKEAINNWQVEMR